jgi:hypothetical protein
MKHRMCAMVNKVFDGLENIFLSRLEAGRNYSAKAQCTETRRILHNYFEAGGVIVCCSSK